MQGYQSKIALCLLCLHVINTNLLIFVKSKKTSHPAPHPSNTLIKIKPNIHSTCSPLSSLMIPENKQVISVDMIIKIKKYLRIIFHKNQNCI